ncbi:MAG: hypothetical protein ACXABY_09970, partial [Candidatus Thorarchaeota archaeon]
MFGQKHTQPGLFNVPVVCEVTNEAINDAFQSLSRQLNDEVSPALRKHFDRDTGEIIQKNIRCGEKGPAQVTCEDPSDWTSEVGSELNEGSAFLVVSVSGDADWLWAITNTGATKGIISTYALDDDGFPLSTTPTATASSASIRSVISWHATNQDATKLACMKSSTLQLLSMVAGVPTIRGSLVLPSIPATPNQGRWLDDRLLIFPKVSGEILWVIDCSDMDNPSLEHRLQTADSGGETWGHTGFLNAAEDTLFIVGTNGVESWDWPVKATEPVAVSFADLSWANNAIGYSEDDSFMLAIEYRSATAVNFRTVDIGEDGQTLSINTIGTVSGTFTNFVARAAVFGTNSADPYISFHWTQAAAHGVLTFSCSDLTTPTITDDQAGTGSFNSTYARFATNDTWFWDWGDLGQATEVFAPAETEFTIECQVELGRILFTQQDIPCADVRVIAGIPEDHGIIVNLDADLLDNQEGSYYLNHGNHTGLADDDHPQYLSRQFANGTFKESFDALITSDGVTITCTLDTASGVTGLSTQFSDGVTDFTVPATVTCTAGTDVSPQANYIYVLQSTGALTKSTSDWPATEHIKVAFVLVPSAAFVQSNGVYVNQNWNDHLAGTDNQGHLSHIAERSRLQGAIYHDGIGGAGTTDYVTITSGSPDVIDLKVATGTIYQMHRHTVPAFDTSGGDEFLVPNDSVTAYTTGTDLADFLTDAAGVSMSGKYYNLVLWGVGNKTGEFAPMMVNLPLGSYNLEANALADASSYDVFTIPDAFNKESSTGFLIARITLKHSAAGGGTWTHVATQDLRGLSVSAAASGGGGTLSDHGALSGLADDDHTQYSLADGTRDFTGVVIGVAPVLDLHLATKKYVDDEVAGAGGGVTDHGALTGLADDDHTQYLLEDGSRPLSASWNMGDINVRIGETSNTKMSRGLTIGTSFGGTSSSIFDLKQSSHAHGFTTHAEADTFFSLRPDDGGGPHGAEMQSLSEDDIALQIRGFYTVGTTGHNISARAPIELAVSKLSGTAGGDPATGENLVSIRAHTRTVWLVDKEGDTWQEGNVFINENNNTFMDFGMTINAGSLSYSSEMLALKGNIAHGMTGETETDTFATFNQHINLGGLGIIGYGASSSKIGVAITGVPAAPSSSLGSNAQGSVTVYAKKASGTGTTVPS